jgi:rod shape-determining protein MreD
VTVAAAARIALIVFVVAILQVSAFSSISILGAAPDVLLVTLIAVGLLRGAILGAVAGFAAGLIVDVAILGTLGVTSLLLTLAAFWAGRYGETTGRGRTHAPLVAALAATVFVDVGGYVLDSLLGGPVILREVVVSLPAALVLNGLLAYPVYALIRRLVGATERVERAGEVELVV